MKKSIFFVLIMFIMLSKSNAQHADSIAVKHVEAQLAIIHGYLKDNKSDSALKRVNAVTFLTLLTGIASESDGNYIGQLQPTVRDLHLWEGWLRYYKDKIVWDEARRAIIVHNEIILPKFNL